MEIGIKMLAINNAIVFFYYSQLEKSNIEWRHE